MAGVWSEERKLERWLEVELAAIDAWAELGVVPASAARAIRDRGVAPTPARVREIEERTHHDVAAFVDAVAENLGDDGRWFHYGLTSSDVIDTALSLQVQEAGALILAGLDRAGAVVARRAEEHRDTIAIGRTHGVHAEPTTFGLKLAGWAFELDRNRIRIERALEGLRVGKLSGAVGTYAATDPEVERIACERLGLEPAPTSTQILQRDRHAELLATLAVAAASLEKFALEIRHLALVRRARGRARRVSRPRLHARQVRLAGRRARRLSRADAAEPRSQSLPLLQPARAARARRDGPLARRGVPPGAAERDARVGGGSGLPRARAGRFGDLAAARPRHDLLAGALHTSRRRRLRAPAGARAKGGPRSCLRPRRRTSAAARFASCTHSTTSGCCSSRAIASRRSTSCSRQTSPTRDACSPAFPRSGSRGRATS